MKQHFTPQEFDDFVVKGNTAVLKCHLPSFVREYVVVDSWIRNDGHILKMTENKGEFSDWYYSIGISIQI